MRRQRSDPKPRPLVGQITVPGDKSISHRALVFGALATGTSRIARPNVGADVLATAAGLAQLGVHAEVDVTKAQAVVQGQGWDGFREATDVVDAGNSGTTLRTMLGVCAGLPGATVLTGDGSLRKRPMLRVVAPLRQMGATIDGRAHGDLAPLHVRGGDLRGVDLELPIASAQVKTAVLLAGLRASGTTSVAEPGPSRDHTERMFEAMGIRLERRDRRVALRGGQLPDPFELVVPGDISSAMFLIAAAAIVPGSDLTIDEVGLNPTRTGALEVMRQMGADLEWTVTDHRLGEPVGSIVIRQRPLQGVTLDPAAVPTLIDEIPALAIVASQAEGETVIRGAAELRVKESDRISALATGLRAMGAESEELPDGLIIRGPARLTGGEVDSRGDHRIALAFAVAGLVASERMRVIGWSCVATSFPEFLDVLGEVTKKR